MTAFLVINDTAIVAIDPDASLPVRKSPGGPAHSTLPNNSGGVKKSGNIDGLENGAIVTRVPISASNSRQGDWVRISGWRGKREGTQEEAGRFTSLDDRGLNLIANMERNLSGVVFNAETGVIISIPTTAADVGYGRDRTQRPMNPEPKEVDAMTALQFLKEDVLRCEEVVETFPLYTQDQFNALVSLRFNIGSLGVVPGLVDYLNAGIFDRNDLGNLINSHYRAVIAANPNKFEQYRQGWYNRTERFLDVFFDGNYGHMPIDAVNGVVIR